MLGREVPLVPAGFEVPLVPVVVVAAGFLVVVAAGFFVVAGLLAGDLVDGRVLPPIIPPPVTPPSCCATPTPAEASNRRTVNTDGNRRGRGVGDMILSR